MVGGVRFAESCCVAALGIDIDGVKHPIALAEGSTENATLVRDLLAGARDLGLDVTKPILMVIDGAEGAAGRGKRGVRAAGDRPLLVPRQATFARFTISRSRWSWACRLRQAM